MKILFIVLVLVSSAACAKEHIYLAASDTVIKSLAALDLNSDDDSFPFDGGGETTGPSIYNDNDNFESSTSDNEVNEAPIVDPDRDEDSFPFDGGGEATDPSIYNDNEIND